MHDVKVVIKAGDRVEWVASGAGARQSGVDGQRVSGRVANVRAPAGAAREIADDAAPSHRGYRGHGRRPLTTDLARATRPWRS